MYRARACGPNPSVYIGLPPHILIGEQLPDEFGRTVSGPFAGEPATLPIPNRHLVALVGEAPRMLHFVEIIRNIRLAEHGYDLIIAGAVEGIGLARCNVVAWGYFRMHVRIMLSGRLDCKGLLKVHDLTDLLVRLQAVQEPATAHLNRLFTVQLGVEGNVLGEAKGSGLFCGVHVVIIQGGG